MGLPPAPAFLIIIRKKNNKKPVIYEEMEMIIIETNRKISWNDEMM